MFFLQLCTKLKSDSFFRTLVCIISHLIKVKKKTLPTPSSAEPVGAISFAPVFLFPGRDSSPAHRLLADRIRGRHSCETHWKNHSPNLSWPLLSPQEMNLTESVPVVTVLPKSTLTSSRCVDMPGRNRRKNRK